MNIEELRDICISLPHVTEDIKWGNNLCFLVVNKIFLISAMDESPIRASFKIPYDLFNHLIERDGIYQAPYLAKRQWVMIENIEYLSTEQWRGFTKQSYNLIVSKLSKRIQEKLK
ncbi:MAG: MmcQ/YjbR family DNA-binding protein [Flavobacteriales bacterium]|nr:MmcQ/YjbR family DNA-binding protein [Flavobacteriales bacterium]